MQSKKIFCVDIGGTKTAFALYDENGNELFYHHFSTNPKEGASRVVERIYEVASSWLDGVNLGVIASPGPLDAKNGKIEHIATMGWKDIAIVKLFTEKFGFEFLLLNDCDAGALGAWKFCGFEKYKTLCYVSVSTGIGGGIVIDGMLFTGSGNGANFGHVPTPDKGLKCPCGGVDCLELYASGSGIEKRYESATGNSLSCWEIASLASSCDETAKRIFTDAGRKLAMMLTTLTQIVDPDIIVMGGSVCKAEKLFMPTVREALPKTNFAFVMSGKQVLLGALCYGLQKRE